jgi:hypothetical protein
MRKEERVRTLRTFRRGKSTFKYQPRADTFSILNKRPAARLEMDLQLCSLLYHQLHHDALTCDEHSETLLWTAWGVYRIVSISTQENALKHKKGSHE